jgi:hypothetical protein
MAAPGLRVPDDVVDQPGAEPVLELVVLEIGEREARALLQHDDGKSRLRQLAREHAASSAGAHDREIDRLGQAILPGDGFWNHLPSTMAILKPG